MNDSRAAQYRLAASVGVRRQLERWPRLHHRWVSWRSPYPTAFGDDSDLLIEGFPGSANSYTRAWIHFANPSLTIASHQHSPAVIRLAIDQRVPVIILYREPLAAVSSMLARFPRHRLDPPYGPRRLLRWYERIYEPVVEHPDDVVLATFEEATTDLGPTVDALNARFGTAVAPLDPVHWPAVIDYLATKDADEGGPASGSAPDTARDGLKESFLQALNSPDLAGERERAQAMYEELDALRRR